MMTLAERFRQEARQEGRQEGREEGREEGRQEGREELRQEIVRNLLQLGIPIAQIAKATNLSVEVVRGLTPGAVSAND